MRSSSDYQRQNKDRARVENIAEGREYGSIKQWNLVGRIESVLQLEYMGASYEEMRSFINTCKPELSRLSTYRGD